MPSRNILKQDVMYSYYHVYARGNNQQAIFIDDADYRFFLSLIRRYLSIDDAYNQRGIGLYKNLRDDVELAAYCLMSNHFHLMLYQINQKGMSSLMRRVMTSYSQYFNRKYKRRGPLFESRYRASRVTTDTYLLHISRYIHLNPSSWRDYSFSSLRYYLDNAHASWITTHHINRLFTSQDEYQKFLEDYQETNDQLKFIRHELANG